MKKIIFATICLLSVSTIFFSVNDNRTIHSEAQTTYLVDPGGH